MSATIAPDNIGFRLVTKVPEGQEPDQAETKVKSITESIGAEVLEIHTHLSRVFTTLRVPNPTAGTPEEFPSKIRAALARQQIPVIECVQQASIILEGEIDPHEGLDLS